MRVPRADVAGTVQLERDESRFLAMSKQLSNLLTHPDGTHPARRACATC